MNQANKTTKNSCLAIRLSSTRKFLFFQKDKIYGRRDVYYGEEIKEGDRKRGVGS